MRVGILTFTDGDNYGQRLQNYALQEVLKEYSNQVSTIRQIPPFIGKKRLIKKVLGFLSFNKYYWDNIKRGREFRKFDHKYIDFYCEKIGENRIPSNINRDFDFFVCGSDQIWSPYSSRVNSTLFIQFSTPEKRVCYAPSIAATEIDKNLMNLYIDYWKGFRYISIREDNFKELIKDKTGIEAEVHLDPTLLFNKSFWKNIAKPPKIDLTKDYILCYFLGSREKAVDYVNMINNENYELVDIMNDRRFYTIPPQEFIYLIMNARLVITDSYHGTLFSIIFHKSFIIMNREGEAYDMRSRFDTLSRTLGIENRFQDQLVIKDLYNLDYTKIDDIILQESKKSREYLKKCFGVI